MSGKTERPWHYSLEKTPAGPVDGTTIKLLVSSGILSADSLVWQEGMDEWRRVGDTPLGKRVPPKSAGYVQTNATVPTPEPRSVPYRPFKASKRSLKTPYITWLVLFSLNFAATMFATYRIYQDDYNYFIWLRFITSLLAAIPMLVLFGRCWSVVQDGYAEINPREAVGLLFVPIFHLYWFFEAFGSLPKTLNRFIERHFAGSSLRRTTPVLAVIYCITALVNMAFSAYVYIDGCYRYNFQTFAISLALVMLAYTGLTMWAMTDTYQSAKSIVSEAG